MCDEADRRGKQGNLLQIALLQWDKDRRLSPQRSHLGQSCRTNSTQDQKICQRERRAGMRLNWNFPWLLVNSCKEKQLSVQAKI